MLEIIIPFLFSVLTLTILEVALGIDNIIFVSILASKLPSKQEKTATIIGLTLATFLRIGFLFFIQLILSWNNPLIYIFSIRDLILLFGGAFLIGKSLHEIHEKIVNAKSEEKVAKSSNMWRVIIEIAIINIIFSLDSILTAIGLTTDITVMVVAVIISSILMIIGTKYVSDFIHKHPSFKILALAFLIMIGSTLISEAFHKEVDKKIIYITMVVSVGTEIVNTIIRTRKQNAKKN